MTDIHVVIIVSTIIDQMVDTAAGSTYSFMKQAKHKSLAVNPAESIAAVCCCVDHIVNATIAQDHSVSVSQGVTTVLDNASKTLLSPHLISG